MRDAVLTERAKSMRKEQTPAEQTLWLALRARRFADTKFRRQLVVGQYIIDFACRAPTMLAIEIDGDSHGDTASYDARRSAYLETKGYRVVRFTNSDVLTNLDGVLQVIEVALATHSPSPNPLP
jgi:very-short-patch-repair endonuclease